MEQAISVHGRIKMIESRIKSRATAAAPIFPKGFNGKDSPRNSTKVNARQSAQLSDRLSSATMSLELLGNQLEKTTEQNKAKK